MTKNERREAIIVAAIVGISILAGLLLTLGRSEIPVISGQTQALNTSDFILNIDDKRLEVGTSSWAAAAAVFPGGKTMGMSTVYSTAPDDYLLTFTEKDNILCKADVYTSAITTYRDLKAGMTFAQVKKAYGNNYVRIGKKNRMQDFDIVYGTDENHIVFNIKNDKVWRIVVQRESK